MWFYSDMTSTNADEALHQAIQGLGNRQRKVLGALARHGSWNGTDWAWENQSTTKTVMNALVRRGMADIVELSTHAEIRPTRDVEIYFTGKYIIR